MHLLESNVTLELATDESEMNDISESDDQMDSVEQVEGNFNSLIEDSAEAKVN